MANTQPSGIKFASGNLNSATINAMNTTAQTLIAAPGSGLINLYLYGFFNIHIGSTAWGATDFGNTWLVYGSTANDQVNLASGFLSNTMDNMVANTSYVFGCAGGIGADWLGSTIGNVTLVTTANSVNKVIAITCSNAILVAGNGNIDWKVWYMTVPAT